MIKDIFAKGGGVLFIHFLRLRICADSCKVVKDLTSVFKTFVLMGQWGGVPLLENTISHEISNAPKLAYDVNVLVIPLSVRYQGPF